MLRSLNCAEILLGSENGTKRPLAWLALVLLESVEMAECCLGSVIGSQKVHCAGPRSRCCGSGRHYRASLGRGSHGVREALRRVRGCVAKGVCDVQKSSTPVRCVRLVCRTIPGRCVAL